MATTAQHEAKGFGILHLNIRSLVKYREQLCAELLHYDIIAISETWLHPMVSDRLIDIDGYSVMRQDRDTCTPNGKRKKGGGIVIYIESSLYPYVTMIKGECNQDGEELWISICKPGNKKAILGIIYRPPSGSVTTFLKTLDKTLSLLVGKGNPNNKELYILGDFNIDFSRKNSDGDKTKLKDIIITKYNMRQLIKTPTHSTSNSNSLIDLIFTSVSPNLVIDSGTLNVCISDHLPIYIRKKKKREKHPKKTIHIRRTVMYKYDNFACILVDDPNWYSFWNDSHDVDALWDIMVNTITNTLDILCPWIQIQIREDQPDWYDGEINSLIRDKNRQYNIACTLRLPAAWEKLRTCKKSVRVAINKKKRKYIMGKLSETRSNPKKFWKSIQQNLHFGKEKGNKARISVKDKNGNVLFGKNLVGPMNEYYARVGASLAEHFTKPWVPPPIPGIVYNIPLMTFRFIGEKEIVSLIKSLNVHKSSQLKGISTQYLKDALVVLTVEFTYLINKCLDDGIMPNAWCAGTITPVPKNGMSKAMPDYRPISVLPSPSKLIERAVYNQLIYHLESYGLLDNRQHGFRRDHSTCSAVFEFTQYLYNNVDNRKFISCVFIDYSKAFDTIDHEIMCKKLQLYGLSPGVITWCCDYLSHRRQRVKIENHISDNISVNYGVPQGSILGPLFFIMYVNDLLSMFGQDMSRILLYADDTVIYYADREANVACSEVERGLNIVHNWCETNKLTINVKKTKHMLVSPRHIKNGSVTVNVKMGDIELENVCIYNYLGVMIDNTLSFGEFLKSKCNKINQRLYQLSKMRKFITSDIACTLYKQAILPLFDYADFLIDSGPNYYVKKIDALHEKALQLIDCKKSKNVDLQLLETMYKLMTPSRRRKEHHCSIMYGLSVRGENIDEYRPTIRLRSRRKVKFKNHRRNLEKIKKSPFFRGLKLWDMIPDNIQRSVTKFKFKMGLRYIAL